ncbi:hypothetical protein [Bradymonas sediminis]|nr:hypothetical protein [Bradymonas sediminis]TDP62639.1 hypothetical protein DFR33_11244 [Bradymonas sediminis]
MMHILRPNHRRSLIALAALATLLATGCATTGEASSDAADDAATAQQTADDAATAQQAADDAQAEAPKGPLRPTRAQLDSLAKATFEQLAATDLAQGWDEAAGTDEAAVVLLAPFKTTRADLAMSTESMSSRIETSLVNDSGADVLGPPGEQLYELFDGTEIPRSTPEQHPDFAELLDRAYIIHGTFSEVETDADTSDFTLTLRVLKSGHDGPLAESSETITVTREAPLTGE